MEDGGVSWGCSTPPLLHQRSNRRDRPSASSSWLSQEPLPIRFTEILRNGSRALLAQAVETEVADFLGRYADLKTEAGHRRASSSRILPEREIMTGIGAVAVHQPRVRDREAIGGQRIGSARAFCRPTPGTQEPRSADPDPVSKGVPPGTSRRRSARCSARTPAGCQPEELRA